MYSFCFPKKLLVLLVLSVAVLTGCKEPQPPFHPVLLISFDGFRHDYLEFADTPHFDSLAAEGILAEGLIPVFPTKTFPNHYSMVTGLYPENTGFVGNTMYDPEWDAWYIIRNREAVEDGRWYRGEPIWNTAEKQGLKTGTMFWVGSEADIQGMRPTYWKRYDGDMPDEARIDTVVKWLALPGNDAVDLATLYFELVDDAGHWYGTRSDSLVSAIGKADAVMGYLKKQLRLAGLWNDMNIVIVSDHGMADLSADRMIELDTIIGMDDVKWIVWDPATMIEPKDGKTEEIYRRLKQQEQNYRVYRKEELPERYHLKNHRRVPAIIMVADIGYTILSTENKSRFLSSLPAGTHGYDNSAEEMAGFFLAYGPAFKNGKRIASFQNIHTYELLNYLLGTEPAPNDGSLDSVRVMFK